MLTSPTYNLKPIECKIEKQELIHLLRRSLFGVGHKELSYFKEKTIQEILHILLKPSLPADIPLQDDPDIIDPLVPKGKTWINAPYENDDIDKYRRIALRAWWTGNIITRDFSLTEKMTLFWHNHFVTEMDVVKDSRYSYSYVALLRKHALGNFKQLIREGSTNVAMLVYLNGNGNEQNAPNENYSRELMELFTIGKEEVKGYSESDVKAAARVLSGWKDDKEKITAVFHPELHDTGDKHFSAFFDNAVIRGVHGEFGGSIELDELIDIIFKRRETAKFVCRNLYRWFVCSQIGEEVEKQIIDPLAQIFIDHDFEIIPVLETLLSSEHFFDTTFRGCIVKNPVEFFIGATQQFDIVFPEEISQTHLCWAHYYFNIGGLSMSIGDPPSVAGWPAFHQAPKFHQWWINSYTLGFRMKITESLYLEEGTNCNGPKIKFDYFRFAKALKGGESVNELIEESLFLLLATRISTAEKDKLKRILLKEMNNESEWKTKWEKVLKDPTDMKTKTDISNRLRLFFGSIMNMPEYQMM